MQADFCLSRLAYVVQLRIVWSDVFPDPSGALPAPPASVPEHSSRQRPFLCGSWKREGARKLAVLLPSDSGPASELGQRFDPALPMLQHSAAGAVRPRLLAFGLQEDLSGLRGTGACAGIKARGAHLSLGSSRMLPEDVNLTLRSRQEVQVQVQFQV